MESESECTAGSSAKRMRVESATGVSGENQQVTPRYDSVCVWGGGGGGGGFISSSLIRFPTREGERKKSLIHIASSLRPFSYFF